MLVLLLLLILLLYIVLIISYIFGWKIIPKTLKQTDNLETVSVVIPMRNEEKEIKRLLKNLKKQNYPPNKLEFILVNDHSNDNTLDLLKESTEENIKIIDLDEGKFGKKDAVFAACNIAVGDIILVSDADCSFTNNWVKVMVSYFVNNDIKLVSGPVSFNTKTGIFQSFQALEFISLIGVGAGAIGIKNPIFCNGANMAYRKEVFLELNNYNKNDIVSGDDVFLLHSVKSRYPDSILFAKHQEAIVTTNASRCFKDFINQRKRWTAKSIYYEDVMSLYVSYLTLSINLVSVFLFIMSFFDSFFAQYFFLFYSIKFIVDYFMLSSVLNFFNRKDLIKWIFPFGLVYSFYIVLIVFLSFTRSFEWKGRIQKR